MAYMKFRQGNRARWVGVQPGHDGEQVWSNGGVDNGTAIVYTVPAGKVFMWTGYEISISVTALAGWYNFMEYSAVPALEKSIISLYLPAASNIVVTKSYWPPVEVPAGKSFRISSGVAGMLTFCTVTGWAENV